MTTWIVQEPRGILIVCCLPHAENAQSVIGLGIDHSTPVRPIYNGQVYSQSNKRVVGAEVFTLQYFLHSSRIRSPSFPCLVLLSTIEWQSWSSVSQRSRCRRRPMLYWADGCMDDSILAKLHSLPLSSPNKLGMPTRLSCACGGTNSLYPALLYPLEREDGGILGRLSERRRRGGHDGC